MKNLNWNLTKEEYEAEICDFLYGIESDGRELTDEELEHLHDLIYSSKNAPSVYDLPYLD